MNSKSLRRVWRLGSVLTLYVVIASCSSPVPMGSSTNGGGGSGKGTSGSGADNGSGTVTPIDLDPGATSTSVSTGTDVTEQENCGITTNETTKQVADLLLILDRSGSMEYAMDRNTRCNTGGGVDSGTTNCVARWPTMKTALAQVLSTSADTVHWGLKLYSTPKQSACTVSDGVEVAIATGNASLLNAQINNSANAPAEGRTPTREALKKGTAYLKTLTGPESKSILLATDGQPNCKEGSTDAAQEDVAATTAAIQAAFDAGFKVYILGIGPDMSADALNDFAAAGGTSLPDVGGPGKNYYAALSAEDLSKHFHSIVGSVASCTFTLQKAPDPSVPVVVEFDGDKSLRAPQDSSNGWSFTTPDRKTIQLHGSWCDGLTSGAYKTAKVLFGCKDHPIP